MKASLVAFYGDRLGTTTFLERNSVMQRLLKLGWSMATIRTIAISIVVLTTLDSQGFAQNRTTDSTNTAKRFTVIPGGSGTARFYGRDGSSAGRADTSRNTTRFYGKDGSSASRAERSGNTIRFYNRDGSSAGRAEISGTTTRFYDRDGSSAGQAQQSGTTTRFYGKDGASSGRADSSGKTTRFYGKNGSSDGRVDR